MKPMPPCGSHCPRRCAAPNCHDPAICGAWAAYQAKLAQWRRDWQAETRSHDDFKTAKRQVIATAMRREKQRRRRGKNA